MNRNRVASALSQPWPHQLGRALRIGILLPNWIGDLVMATPALRALRDHYGTAARLVGIGRPFAAELLAGTPWLDELVRWDRRSSRAAHTTRAVASQLRDRQLDQLLVLPNSFSSGYLAWLSGARERIGFARNLRGWMLTTRLFPPRTGRRLTPLSAVDYYLQVVNASGVPAAHRHPELAVTAEENQLAAAVLAKLDIGPGSLLAVLNPWAAYGSAKQWPLEVCSQTARTLAQRWGARILVLCGPQEWASARQVVHAARHPFVVTFESGQSSIGLSKACIRRADWMISTDSGPRHIAAALGTPTLALFGPTDPRWSQNYGPQEVPVWEPIECGPCGQRTCPLQHRACMHRWSPDRLLALLPPCRKSVCLGA